MGTTKLDLTTLDLGRLQELMLKLEDPSNTHRSLGELRVNVTLWPRTQEDKEQVVMLKNYFLLFYSNCKFSFIVFSTSSAFS